MNIEINCSEKDIEDFLCEKLNLERYLSLKLIKRQMYIYEQYIDILAYSYCDKSFYIIELKRNKLDSKALAQAIKYKRLLHTKYGYKHTFKILLIGEHLDEDLYYCVNHYKEMENNPILTYTLFSYNLMHGISFNYYNIAQNKIEKELRGKNEKQST